jgi:hypothetical protein
MAARSTYATVSTALLTFAQYKFSFLSMHIQWNNDLVQKSWSVEGWSV